MSIYETVVNSRVDPEERKDFGRFEIPTIIIYGFALFLFLLFASVIDTNCSDILN
jgi:hypothetical protein